MALAFLDSFYAPILILSRRGPPRASTAGDRRISGPGCYAPRYFRTVWHCTKVRGHPLIQWVRKIPRNVDGRTYAEADRTHPAADRGHRGRVPRRRQRIDSGIAFDIRVVAGGHRCRDIPVPGGAPGPGGPDSAVPLAAPPPTMPRRSRRPAIRVWSRSPRTPRSALSGRLGLPATPPRPSRS